MKAAVVTRFGGPEVIKLVDMPTPSPGRGQVLIKVLAIKVNRLDHHIRQGGVPKPMTLPHVLGMDAVGEVAECGFGVKGFVVGDRVMVMPGYPENVAEWDIRPATSAPSYVTLGLDISGTYAQYIVVPEKWVIADTSGLPPEQAVTLPTALLTAIRAVQTVGEVKAGDKVLVHAGVSGSGSMSIQVAKALGADVITTVCSSAEIIVARQVGADRVINIQDEDFVSAVSEWTNGRGVDVAIDGLGGPDFERTIDCVRAFGIVVAMGFMAGTQVSFDISRFYSTQKQIRGTLMGDIEDLEHWMHRVRAGHIKPLVDTVLPLSEAASAHEMVAKNNIQGGVVLLPWCH